MPISPTLPTDGSSDWDVPLNAALTEIVDEVNAQETDIAGKANTSHTHGVGDLTATGTPSSTTYLRGDNTWATPAGGGGGAVDSVNGATGTVVLDQDDVLDGTTYKQYSATEKTKLAGVATGATANSSDATLLARANHTGSQSADTIVDGTTNHVFTSADDTKLAGIATGATANDTDANLKARANHTGTQAVSTLTITGTPDGTKFLRDDSVWATPAGGGGAAALDDLTDVVITSPAAGDFLKWDTGTSKWVDGPLPAGGASVTGARLYLNAATLSAASGARVILLDTTESIDTGFSYNSGTGELTLTNAGWYQVFGHVRLNAAVSTGHLLSIMADAASSIRSSQITASSNDLMVTGIDYYSAGAKLTMEYTSGASTTVAGGNRYHTCLRVMRVA